MTKWTFQWWWKQKLGRPECPYLIRTGISFGLFSIRIHNWISSDDDRHFHDHPWSFITLVLRGGYTDVSPSGEHRMTPGKVAYRHALHQHTVQVDKGGCLTIIITGPQWRKWGFWVGKKFKKANKYFLEHGHHPCQ